MNEPKDPKVIRLEPDSSLHGMKLSPEQNIYREIDYIKSFLSSITVNNNMLVAQSKEYDRAIEFLGLSLNTAIQIFSERLGIERKEFELLMDTKLKELYKEQTWEKTTPPPATN